MRDLSNGVKVHLRERGNTFKLFIVSILRTDKRDQGADHTTTDLWFTDETVIIMVKITVAVVGAGVIGLTSAYSIKLFDENADVTVFAEKFSPNTTSDGAAGAFLISGERMRDTPKHLLK